MLCQICQKRVANTHFTQTINNKKVEMYLCEQCSKEKGKLNFGFPLGINDFFSGFMNLGQTDSLNKTQMEKAACKKCGTSFEEFKKSGKLGCRSCYDTFSDKLAPLIKRIHGNAAHNGKVPHKLSETIRTSREIEKLKIELNKAIQREEYEKAAQLRDRIKSIEASAI